MFYIFLFLITASVIGEAVFKIRKKRKITKYALAKITIPLVLLLLCIVDMFFLLFGGMNKLTNMKEILGYSHNSSTYILSVMVDTDGKIYITSDLTKSNLNSNGEEHKSIRVTYLPCTRTVIKLEQKPEDSYNIPIDDTAQKSTDGYRELYDFSRDTLPFTIATIGIFLIILLIVRIIRSRKNE